MTERQGSPTASATLFTLLIFLLTTKVLARFIPHVCSPSSCGEIETIAYPFRLKTDPAGCGEPDFELSCENNKTILELHSGKYLVKRISYDVQRLRVVDVNLANGTCSLPYKSVSVDEFMDDDHYSLDATTYTSFIKCSSNLSDQAYRLVPCLSGNGTNVYVSYVTYIISSLQGSCLFVSRVPTVYQAVLFPSYDSILQLMQTGFDLEWCIGWWYSSSSYGCYRSDYYLPPWLAAFSVVWDFLSVVYLVGRFILAPIGIFGFLIHKYMTTKKASGNEEIFLVNQQHLMPKRYTFSDIIAITNNFKDKLGQGGFGNVYKGQLRDAFLVAVKMLGNAKCNDEDFINEVSIIGRTHHVNIVRLVGFCSEGSYRALVFEYMANGSLDKLLFSRETELLLVSWEKLLQIAVGTARGIEHLHGGCSVCILHLDIKPHNVLLDSNFIPKVSDFGLAKFYPREKDFVSISTTRGTVGYVAPEMISRNLGAVSCKSDVYSFGMLLLEMAGRRRKSNSKGNCSSEVYFPSWVYDHLSEGGDLELENVTEIEAAIARKLCIVGLWCIQKAASDRPTMTKVVEMLGANINDLQLPSNALSFPQSISKEPQSDSSTELLIPETADQSL
uniref:Protein kinase domain-containing protein n=1 Tax=Populus davidiana TaxID=266767 RepID=A0A6M2FB17_9ROSI